MTQIGPLNHPILTDISPTRTSWNINAGRTENPQAHAGAEMRIRKLKENINDAA